MLDWSLLWGVDGIAVTVFEHASGRRGFRYDAVEGAVAVELNVLYWLYFAPFESLGLQAPPGKKLYDLIVTDDAGIRISFGRATGRYFAKIISVLPLGVGLMMVDWTHDYICKTLILRQAREQAPATLSA